MVEISVYNPNDGQNHLLRSGTADLSLETVDISFWRGSYPSGPIDLGRFYTEDVDLVRVEGAVIPEPSALLVWSLLAVVGMGWRWCRRRK